MFKKFNPKEDIASSTSIKSSVQRQIRSKLLSQMSLLSAAAEPSHSISKKAAGDSDSDDDGSSDDEPTATKNRKKGAQKEKEKLTKKGNRSKSGKGQEAPPFEAPPHASEGIDEEESHEKEETLLDVLWPKKEGLTLIKCREHISILALHKEPLFFQHFDGPYYPTLKLLHRYPALLPRVQVDRGAIKFVLAGANIMCPGLTSPSAELPERNLPVGTPVAVYAYGKELALGIGLCTMSTDDIKKINKNVGVENISYLGDDLWSIDQI